MPAQVVERARLFERLSGGRGRRLTLVACPAGFGKSMLLAAWREQEANEGDDERQEPKEDEPAGLCQHRERQQRVEHDRDEIGEVDDVEPLLR